MFKLIYMKRIIKSLLTRFNCAIFKIPYKKGLYIGYASKITGCNISIEEKVSIMPYSMIVSLDNGRIEIGEGSTISMFSRIGSVGYVKIGKDIEMEPNCFIADFNHEYRDISLPIKTQGKSFRPLKKGVPNIYIGDGSWLGTHVVIVGNINIGKHCVIGANSVVTKDIPDYCVAVGSPARIIKKYNHDKGKWENVL